MISSPSDYDGKQPGRPDSESHEAHARESPLAKPATETAHADASDVSAAAAKQNQGHGEDASGPGAEDRGREAGQLAKETDAPTSLDARPRQHAVLPEDVYPSGIDVDNDASSDSTLDTDGKDHDTKRLGRMDDNEVVSNASADNVVPTPPSGLAGIDSRPGGNRPAILAEPGSAVHYKGFVEDTRLYETAGDSSEAESEVKFEEHLPPNHARAAQFIQITSSTPDVD